MSAPPKRFILPDRPTLEPGLLQGLDAAREFGASAAEGSVSVTRGLSVMVRKGEVESLEFHHDRSLNCTVYVGARSGSAGTADLTPAGIRKAVQAACEIAKVSGEDSCSGLADANRMASKFPDLDLDHEWNLEPEAAIDIARRCEASALAVPRVSQSEGASLHTARGVEMYANTHGFVGERRASDHYLACSAIVGEGESMKRDDWYSSSRHPESLESAEAIGRRAGERAVARIGARKLGTRVAPILFAPDMARSLWSHFIAAISGGALYRKASFLLDKAGEQVFAPIVRLEQQPFIPRGANSAAFDQEGVATTERVLVDAGVLQGYVLSSYTARKLKLESTGNAGGVYNMVVKPGSQNFEALVRDMGTGLVVTEMMGQGVNPVTGDYSRGAGGYWVENGKLAHPVEEVTVAGGLPEMFRNIRAIGNDVDLRGNVRTGSVLVDSMTIAGD